MELNQGPENDRWASHCGTVTGGWWLVTGESSNLPIIDIGELLPRRSGIQRGAAWRPASGNRWPFFPLIKRYLLDNIYITYLPRICFMYVQYLPSGNRVISLRSNAGRNNGAAAATSFHRLVAAHHEPNGFFLISWGGKTLTIWQQGSAMS